MQRRLLGQVRVGHQPREQVQQEVEGAAIPRVLDLTGVLKQLRHAWHEIDEARVADQLSGVN